MDMKFEIAWHEFNRGGEIVSKRKAFRTEDECEKFIAKLEAKDSFHRILAYRNGGE